MADFVPSSNENIENSINLASILKVYNTLTNREFATRFNDVNELLSEFIRPHFGNVQDSPYSNEQLGQILTELTKQTVDNTREILYLHRLIALLIFELLEQGIEVESKELINELKIYLKRT